MFPHRVEVYACIMVQSALLISSWNAETFLLGSSVVNVLALSDFDLEKSYFSDSSYRFDRMRVIMTLFIAIIICCKNFVCLMSRT